SSSRKNPSRSPRTNTKRQRRPPAADTPMLNLASKARPYFGAIVLTAVLLTAGGIYSATLMPSGVYPEVTFPRVAVVAKKPGLDLVSTELQVTRPLELAASSVLGLRRVRSTTIRGGCDLSIDFAAGT